MKKIAILTFLILSTIFSVNLFAQDTEKEELVETTEQVGSLIEDATSTLYDGVKTAVNDLAKALEVPATHVYKLLVRQQIVRSVTNLGLFILLVLATLTSIKLGTREFDHDTGEHEGVMWNSYGDVTPYIIVPILLGVLSIFCICATGESIVTGLFNPEYAAIKEITNFIK